MSAIACTLVLFAISAEPATEAEPRSLVATNRTIYALVKQEATAKTPEQRDAAIRAMAALYQDIVRDPRLESLPVLQQYKARLWRKLLDIKKDLERDIARQERLERREYTAAELAERQAIQEETQAVGQSLSEQMALVSHSLGGPTRIFAESRGAFGGGPVRDHGEELVRLIEHTIAPDFWNVNGGPGAIYYYAPLHALVVSATGDVHRKLGGVVGGLRAAGP